MVVRHGGNPGNFREASMNGCKPAARPAAAAIPTAGPRVSDIATAAAVTACS